MSWRIFSPSSALVVGRFRLTALNGSKLVSIWKLPTKSVVTICRSLREHSPRGSSIAVRTVIRNFRESAACVVQSRALPAAANITAAVSIRGFGYGSLAGIADPGPSATPMMSGSPTPATAEATRACHGERSQEMQHLVSYIGGLVRQDCTTETAEQIRISLLVATRT